MQSCLKQLCATEGLNLEMLCVDIKRKPWIDLSQSRERDKLLGQIKQGMFDAIIIFRLLALLFPGPAGLTTGARDQSGARYLDGSAAAASWATSLPILLGRS